MARRDDCTCSGPADGWPQHEAICATRGLLSEWQLDRWDELQDQIGGRE
ncbi:hypothetical protein [Rhodococcus rhodnii]|uniref:Uncharacterized protein n=1 Tax=Rhodococcus rhodnii LMG 5362 TaxID=1273125 RepID=R7WQS4_9NOCA|nr:hypothetical protein [Rhodococcus rhodnii]EOM77666.1 hypothetical protein Rrhod_0985 [Rhodococcus rhodnii LMG 5362]